MNKHSTEKTGKNAALNSEDEKIRSLIGSLKRVDAPKDFDFRVKARIANAKSVHRKPQFFPVLRYVLPLGLIILISAAVVFNSVYFGDAQVPVVAENQIQKESSSDKLSPTKQTGEENIARKADDKVSGANVSNSEITREREFSKVKVNTVAVKSSRKENLKVSQKNYNVDNSGGSLVSASTATPTKQIINRMGIIPGRTIKNLPNSVENVKSLTAKDILFQFGVEAVFTNESWTVKSVRQNSPAERSGVKTGDAVEAIDGEKLTDKPLKNRTIQGKKLTVARGAEKIEIRLSVN